MSRMVSGRDAVRIMVEEIGEVIGQRRLAEFEGKVRADLRKRAPERVTAREWIGSMANVIVDESDTRADQGFRKGIRRIRKQAGDGARLLLPD